MEEYNYSIIIPYFRAQETLPRLLDSIPARKDIQVIVVNDKCPTFADVTASFQRDYNFLENNTERKGAGTCRNIGLSEAKGRFLIFADADDYFVPGAFNIFDKYLTESFDLVFFTPTSIFENSDKKSNRHLFYQMLMEDYLSKGGMDIRYKFFAPWSKLISRKLVDENKIKFDEVRASNDINFSLKVGVSAKSISAEDTSVYCIVESNTSLTKIQTEDVLESRFFALCRYNDILKQNNLDKWQLPMLHYLNAYRKFGYTKVISRLKYVLKNKHPIAFMYKHFFVNIKFRLIYQRINRF